MHEHAGKASGRSLIGCMAASILLLWPIALRAGIETRATVQSDFVITEPIDPIEIRFVAGTELEYRASMGTTFLVLDPRPETNSRIIAIPKQSNGEPSARLAGDKVLILKDLEVTVEGLYRVFQKGTIFKVAHRDGDELVIETIGADALETFRVPASRFNLERVLASDSYEATSSGDGTSSGAEEGYAQELEAFLEQHPPADGPASVEEPVDAVCVIRSGDSAGTGFLIVMDGRVYCITNHHVLGEGHDLTISTSEGETFTPLFFEVAKDRDLARLLIEESPAALTEMDEASYGDSVSVVGNRGGMGVVRMEKAEVIGFAPGIIELDNDFAPGNSGSPVIRDDGRVIGVATFLVSARENQLGEEEIMEGAMLFEDRYFATRLDADIEWIPTSPGFLRRWDQTLQKDETFTADAFTLLQMVARSPFTPLPENQSASMELRQWTDRLNHTLSRNRQALQNPDRQFSNYQDYHAWQMERSVDLLRDMQELLRRLEHRSRSRLNRLRSRMASYPELGYYPSLTEELVRRYELLVSITHVVAEILEQSTRNTDGS